MYQILVDPTDLQAKARQIEEIADSYRGLAQRALQAAQGAPSYDGQFGPKVRAIGNEAHVRLDGLAGRLSDLSRELVQIAEAFAAADASAAAGLDAARARFDGLFGSELDGGLLGLLLPLGVTMEMWRHLPPEDRLALLLELGLYPGGPRAGELYHVLNPLRVRHGPGLNGEIIAYATPGTEVAYIGFPREADGITWYQVRYRDAATGLLVTGWVSSYFLATGKSRVGFEPETVKDRFDVQTVAEVREAGGRLMSVRSDYLQISDGPTLDYAVLDAPEWGRVVRWTGDYIEEGGHTWYEVIYDDDTRGWARGDRVEEYVPRPNAPLAEEGRIWIQLKHERSFSYYTITDIDAYAKVDHGDPWLDSNAEVTWKNGDPGADIPNGSLFSAEGVAMQGSGKVAVGGETRYIQLDNPRELDWVNTDGERTEWGERSWTNGPPARIENPEDAVFRWHDDRPTLTSGVSVAGPPSIRGQAIWVPELAGLGGYNERGVFIVQDAGGAFPEGSSRVDLFFEDPEAGERWYREYTTYRLRHDGGMPAYVQQDLPPAIEDAPGP